MPAAVCVAPSITYLERAYDDAKHGSPSREPFIEALVPSLLDPSVAPAGKHVMSALVQYIPYEPRDGSWDDAARAALGDSVVSTLERYVPGLANLVSHRHVMTPTDLSDRFGLADGNTQHGEMTLDQVFIGRPITGWARYATPIDGLYGCGAGTHPGGGLTGASGANAAAAILSRRS
jgi:phytoene dehydrogenase-like protein